MVCSARNGLRPPLSIQASVNGPGKHFFTEPRHEVRSLLEIGCPSPEQPFLGVSMVHRLYCQLLHPCCTQLYQLKKDNLSPKGRKQTQYNSTPSPFMMALTSSRSALQLFISSSSTCSESALSSASWLQPRAFRVTRAGDIMVNRPRRLHPLTSSFVSRLLAARSRRKSAEQPLQLSSSNRGAPEKSHERWLHIQLYSICNRQ